MVCSSQGPPGCLSWTLRLTLWILLEARALSHPLPAEPQGRHGPEAELGLSQPNVTVDVAMAQEANAGLLPPPCKPGSPRCKKFLDRLQLANRSRLNMLLLVTRVPQMQTLCAAECEDWLASCENDAPCSPEWLPALERRLCALGCNTGGQKFANGADLCLSVLGYAPPMAPPGSQRCPKSSSSAPPRHRQLKMRGSSLGRSRRRAPAWISDSASSGSGSGSGH